MFAVGDHLIDDLLHFVNLRLVPRSASCDRFAAQSLRSFGQPDACGAGESAKMFFETVERDGKTMKRFELVEDAG